MSSQLAALTTAASTSRGSGGKGKDRRRITANENAIQEIRDMLQRHSRPGPSGILMHGLLTIQDYFHMHTEIFRWWLPNLSLSNPI